MSIAPSCLDVPRINFFSSRIRVKRQRTGIYNINHNSDSPQNPDPSVPSLRTPSDVKAQKTVLRGSHHQGLSSRVILHDTLRSRQLAMPGPRWSQASTLCWTINARACSQGTPPPLPRWVPESRQYIQYPPTIPPIFAKRSDSIHPACMYPGCTYTSLTPRGIVTLSLQTSRTVKLQEDFCFPGGEGGG